MHATSQAIMQIIKATPGYSVDVLASDLGIKRQPDDGEDRWLTNNETAKRLNVSTRWLFELRKSGEIPYYIRNSEVRFKQSEVDKVFKRERNGK